MDGAILFILVAAVATALVWLIALGSVRAVRWARKGSPAAAFVGWALLLLGAGMNPQRPPQEQAEQANRQRRIKKDSESGDPEN
jgi:hypothetical protein